MLILAIVAQLATSGDSDSVYTSAALRAFVERAASANRLPPPALAGYRARLESELSFVIRDTLGREQATQIEQIAAAATWTRNERYDLHVLGFRSQSVGVPFSALSFVRGWTVPMLYGNHLRVGLEPTGTNAVVASRIGGRRDTIPIVHPFSPERDRYYRFSGGDTAASLRTSTRVVKVMRVFVQPRWPQGARFAGFRGEIDLDADRAEIVRMRGQYVYDAPSRRGVASVYAIAGVVVAAYVEFVNVEVAGSFWLPAYERTEFQAGAAILGPDRSIFRIQSTFADYVVDTTNTTPILELSSADSLRDLAPHVTFAAHDTIDQYNDWRAPIGAQTGRVAGSDYDDIAPNAWRKDGRPILVPYPHDLGEVLRYNRVEGAFTGVAAELRFRDAAPGVTARAFGGLAWTERTVRGGASLIEQRSQWTYGVRGERSLSSTNDFAAPLSGGTSLGALFGSADYADYVDRRRAVVSVLHDVGASRRVLLSAEAGIGRDAPEVARLQHGLIAAGASFLPNRWAMPGSYVIGSSDLEINPNVSGDFVQSGVGGQLHVEYGRGQLKWLRSELRLAARRYWNDWWLAARASAGVVSGTTIPPQTLFELGGNEGLPGYGYKQFGGDRAALGLAATGVTFPILRTPRRILRNYILPGISPGVAVGLQSGWAEASTAAARRALLLLAGPTVAQNAMPLSVPTLGARATMDLRLTILSGAASAGIAQPLDHRAPWRPVFALGLAY